MGKKIKNEGGGKVEVQIDNGCERIDQKNIKGQRIKILSFLLLLLKPTQPKNHFRVEAQTKESERIETTRVQREGIKTRATTTMVVRVRGLTVRKATKSLSKVITNYLSHCTRKRQ